MQLVNGTKEKVIVDLSDTLGTISDLAPYSGEFTVENNEGDEVQSAESVETDGMRVVMLIDTSTDNPGPWTVGLYKVYVTLTILTESPKLFVGEFYLI